MATTAHRLTESRYGIADYARMLTDESRVRAYTEAINATVKQGDTVLNIGSGLGLFAALSCRAGARMVYAVEPHPISDLAGVLYSQWGLSDRVTRINSTLEDAQLPENVDVIVADLRGTLPYCGSSLRTMASAAERYLKPGGRVIPKRDIVWVAAIESERCWRECVQPWDGSLLPFSLDLVSKAMASLPQTRQISADELVTAPVIWRTIDYLENREVHHCHDVTLQLTRDAHVSAFAVWFNTELCEGIGFSNFPPRPDSVYKSMVFSCHPPKFMRTGDIVSIRIRAEPGPDGYEVHLALRK